MPPPPTSTAGKGAAHPQAPEQIAPGDGQREQRQRRGRRIQQPCVTRARPTLGVRASPCREASALASFCSFAFWSVARRQGRQEHAGRARPQTRQAAPGSAPAKLSARRSLVLAFNFPPSSSPVQGASASFGALPERLQARAQAGPERAEPGCPGPLRQELLRIRPEKLSQEHPPLEQLPQGCGAPVASAATAPYCSARSRE